jgi:RNA polymerase sigma factor (sigma-70 family)
MARGQLDKVLTRLRGLFSPHRGEEPTDGQLLERFVRCREETSFTALLQRHGPLVLSVCRRVLVNEHDAEDAFQATFLVLARKATCIRKRESVASWLYGVAYRIAAKARVSTARRRLREQEKLPLPPGDPISELVMQELRPVLDEEVNRLPEKYRHPVILCYLQNKTNGEAARQLGWSKGTVSGRLARARQLLRARLTRRGVTLSGGMLSAALVQETGAAVPAALETSTVKAAALSAAGQSAAAGAVSAPVAALVEGALNAMWLTKVKFTAIALLATVVLGISAALLTQQVLGARPTGGSEKESPRSERPLEGDLAKLQGTWIGERLEKDGEAAPAKWQFLVKGFKIVIAGKKATVLNPGLAKNVATITVDAEQSPRPIDFSYFQGPARGQKVPGIYALKDGELHLCIPNDKGEKRPTAFATKPNSGLLLLVLKRRPAGGGTARSPEETERDKLTNEIERLRGQLTGVRQELARAKRRAQAEAEAARAAEAEARARAEQARADALQQRALADKLRRDAERQRAEAEKQRDKAKAAAAAARKQLEKQQLEAERAEKLAREALEKFRREQERATKDKKKNGEKRDS